MCGLGGVPNRSIRTFTHICNERESHTWPKMLGGEEGSLCLQLYLMSGPDSHSRPRWDPVSWGGGDVLKGPVGPQCSAWVRYEVYPPCVWEWVYGVCVRYKVTHLGYIYIYTYEVQHRRILEEWFSSVPPSEHGPPTRLRCAERSWLCGGRTAGLQEGQTGNTPRTVAVDQRDRSPQSARSLDGNGRV